MRGFLKSAEKATMFLVCGGLGAMGGLFTGAITPAIGNGMGLGLGLAAGVTALAVGTRNENVSSLAPVGLGLLGGAAMAVNSPLALPLIGLGALGHALFGLNMGIDLVKDLYPHSPSPSRS